MSLLNVTVKKARLIGAQAAQWNCYAILKLQHVKSTTVIVKGANPSWEQDFLFELNNLDAGLLIEVWNKGLIWDKAVGYHWVHLKDIHFSNMAGVGQWLSLDAELVMREGEVVGSKNPTGHVILVDARFELPLGDVEGEEAFELQRKLEMLNSMLDRDDDVLHDQNGRQNQYYAHQCESDGVSEDSDYTSEVNYPVRQHPNSSASQFLSAAHQLETPERSLASSRENSFENVDYAESEDYRSDWENRVPRRNRRLPQPRPNPNSETQYSGTNPTNIETDALYYNSRPQQYKSNSCAGTTDTQFLEVYEDAQDCTMQEHFHHSHCVCQHSDLEPHNLRCNVDQEENCVQQKSLPAAFLSTPYENNPEHLHAYDLNGDSQHSVSHYDSNIYPEYDSQPSNAKCYPGSSDASKDQYGVNSYFHSDFKNRAQNQDRELNHSNFSSHASATQRKGTTADTGFAMDYYYNCSVPTASHNLTSSNRLNADQTFPDVNAYNTVTGHSQDYPSMEETSFENWDFTNGYYDELGNYIPYEISHYEENDKRVPLAAPFHDAENGENYQFYALQDSANLETENYNNGADLTMLEDEQSWTNDYGYTENDQLSYDDSASVLMNKPCDITGPITNSEDLPHQTVQYNFAYQSAENLSASQENLPKLNNQSDSLNRFSRRRSFRRQTSTIDYNGSDCPIEPLLDTHTSESYFQPSAYQTLDVGGYVPSQKSSFDNPQEWVSTEYPRDRTGSCIESYDPCTEYDDDGEKSVKEETGSGGGPVHMDSLESNTSEPGGRDSDANEKFEAQYWQRQRDRIAQQAMTLHTQDSQEYYGIDSYRIEDQGPQILKLADNVPFSQSGSACSQENLVDADAMTGNAEWRNRSIDSNNRDSTIKDQSDEWSQENGAARRELFPMESQETFDENMEDEYFPGSGAEISRLRKHSTVSLDSQGDTLPPTSPPPASDTLAETLRAESFGEENTDERKFSLEVPVKDKGIKNVSFDDEPPKRVPERQTVGMNSKEKWLWSINRVCSQLAVSHVSYLDILVGLGWVELSTTTGKLRWGLSSSNYCTV